MPRAPRVRAGNAPAAPDEAPAAPPVALMATPLADTDEPPPGVEGYGERDFYAGALDDDRGRASFIREVEGLVRRAPEMARYRGYLIDNFDMGSCSILRGLSAEESRAAGLELHHHPLTLYDIVGLVLGAQETDGGRITTYAIANRVLSYHWRGMVGLVPLTSSLHEMAHSGQLAIDPRSVYGNWPALLEECRSGMTESLAAKLRVEAAGWEGDAAERNARLLEVSPQRWAADPPTPQRLIEGPREEDDAEIEGEAESI